MGKNEVSMMDNDKIVMNTEESMMDNDPNPQCRWNCENNALVQCEMTQEDHKARGTIRVPAIVRDSLPINCKWTYGTCCLNKSFCLKGSKKLCNGNKIFEPDENF